MDAYSDTIQKERQPVLVFRYILSIVQLPIFEAT